MITQDKMVERKMVTGQGYGWVLVGVRGCVLRPTGHSLVTLFPCLCWLKTGRCISLKASHRFIIPSTHLGMGAEKTCCSLVVGFGSFLDRMIGSGDGGGPCTALSSGLRSGGLESKFGRGPRPQDRRVMGWSYLCVGYKQGMCFWGTQLRH